MEAVAFQVDSALGSIGLRGSMQKSIGLGAIIFGVLYFSKMPSTQFDAQGNMLPLPYTASGAKDFNGAMMHPVSIGVLAAAAAYYFIL